MRQQPLKHHLIQQQKDPLYQVGERIEYWSYSRNQYQPGRIVQSIIPNQVYLIDKNFKNCHCEVWIGELITRRDIKSDRVLRLVHEVLVEEKVREKIVRDDFSSDSSDSEDDKAKKARPKALGRTYVESSSSSSGDDD